MNTRNHILTNQTCQVKPQLVFRNGREQEPTHTGPGAGWTFGDYGISPEGYLLRFIRHINAMQIGDYIQQECLEFRTEEGGPIWYFAKQVRQISKATYNSMKPKLTRDEKIRLYAQHAQVIYGHSVIVPSSNSSVNYRVTLNPLTCNCPAGSQRRPRKCWHLDCASAAVEDWGKAQEETHEETPYISPYISPYIAEKSADELVELLYGS